MRPAGQTDIEVEEFLLLQHPEMVARRRRPRRRGRRQGRGVVLEGLEGELGAHPESAVRPEVRQNLNLGIMEVIDEKECMHCH